MFEFYIREHYAETQVYPVYGDGFAVRYAETPDEMFKRREVQGDLSFLGADFDYIMAREVNTLLYLRITDGTDEFECQFTRRSGRTDLDDREFTVAPTVKDGYEVILSALDREVNWLAHYPEHRPIDIPVMPIIQIYEAGSRVITCFGHGGWWTQEVETPTFNHVKLRQDFLFGDPTKFWLALTKDNTLSSYVFNPQTYHNEDNSLRLQVGYIDNPSYGTDDPWIEPPYLARWEIVDAQNNVVYADSFYQSQDLVHEGSLLNSFLYKETDSSKTIQIRERRFYMRMVSANGDGSEWTILKPDDLMPKSIYRFGVQLLPVYSGNQNVFCTNAVEDEENRYFGSLPHYYGFPRTPGNSPDPGFEYVAPTWENEHAVPLDPDSWDGFSFWFMPHGQHFEWVSAERYTLLHTLRDAYTFQGFMEAMLRGANLSIQFDCSTALGDSAFFYDLSLFVTPKGNVLLWNYSAPASINTTTLGRVLEMLKKVFRVYWHIDNGRLKLEQVGWYLRGGTYAGAVTPNLDLTEKEEMRGKEKLAFDLNKTTFEALALPFGISHSWADESSQMFKGYGIQYHAYALPGVDLTVESWQAEGVSADLQHALINPDRYSRDGLFLLNALRPAAGQNHRVPHFTFQIGDAEYRVFNGRLCFTYLLKMWHCHDLLTWVHYINTIYTDADLVKPTAIQEVDFPYSTVIDWIKPFKTGLGLGFIKELTVTLDEGYVTGTLKLPEPKNSE